MPFFKFIVADNNSVELNFNTFQLEAARSLNKREIG